MGTEGGWVVTNLSILDLDLLLKVPLGALKLLDFLLVRLANLRELG